MGKGEFQGTEREVCVCLVIDDAFLYQTPGHQQQVATTLKTFFASAKQTHRFPPETLKLCPPAGQRNSISATQNYIVRTRGVGLKNQDSSKYLIIVRH